MTNDSKDVHVEVQLKDECIQSNYIIEEHIINYLKANIHVFQEGIINFKDFNNNNDNIIQYIEQIKVCDIGKSSNSESVSFWQTNLIVHVYKLSNRLPEKDYLESDEEDLPATEQWELPNKYLNDIWDSIIVDERIKSNLLGYIDSSLQFAKSNLNPSIISWNRISLLHGPPGTGKTSLCKGLANKLAIRQRNYFQSSILVEINSHSLFSKWFSESGKLVMKLFDHIIDIAEDPNCLVVVLIDEVESITTTRVTNSSEPGDAVRVVNAVLTSLDSLKRKCNVTVLCTSNIVDMIDPAFRDRLDMQIYLGFPNEAARFDIIISCLNELMRCNIIYPKVILKSDHNNVDITNSLNNLYINNESQAACEQLLYQIVQITNGLSGRQLRKLPLQAHAMFICKSQTNCYEYLCALKDTIIHDQQS